MTRAPLVPGGPSYPLVFLHMGKTGGVTLGRLLRGALPKDRFVSGGGSPTLSALGLQDEAAVHARLAEAGRTAPDAPAVLLTGHIPLPQRPYFSDEKYFSIVREPIDRSVSSYFYLRGQTGAVFDRIRALSLEDYLEAEISLDVNNYQTRILCGDKRLDGVFDGSRLGVANAVGEAEVRTALDQIRRRFVFVGLLEEFDATVILLRRLLRLPLSAMRYEVANKTPSRQPVSAIDGEVLAALRRRNAADLMLYAALRRQFKALKRRQGIGFLVECLLFKAAQATAQRGARSTSERLLRLGERLFGAASFKP